MHDGPEVELGGKRLDYVYALGGISSTVELIFFLLLSANICPNLVHQKALFRNVVINQRAS